MLDFIQFFAMMLMVLGAAALAMAIIFMPIWVPLWFGTKLVKNRHKS